MAETNNEELSPRPLMRILGDFANSQILDASIEYDFFTLIHKGFQSRRRNRARKPERMHAPRALCSIACRLWA